MPFLQRLPCPALCVGQAWDNSGTRGPAGLVLVRFGDLHSADISHPADDQVIAKAAAQQMVIELFHLFASHGFPFEADLFFDRAVDEVRFWDLLKCRRDRLVDSFLVELFLREALLETAFTLGLLSKL